MLFIRLWMYISWLILYFFLARDRNRIDVVPGCRRPASIRMVLSKPNAMYYEQIDSLATYCKIAGWRLNELNLKNDRKKQRWLFRQFLVDCKGFVKGKMFIFDPGMKAVFDYVHHGG